MFRQFAVVLCVWCGGSSSLFLSLFDIKKAAKTTSGSAFWVQVSSGRGVWGPVGRCRSPGTFSAGWRLWGKYWKFASELKEIKDTQIWIQLWLKVWASLDWGHDIHNDFLAPVDALEVFSVETVEELGFDEEGPNHEEKEEDPLNDLCIQTLMLSSLRYILFST